MASPYQVLYTHRQYDDVQKTINYYLNKANGNYNLAASQYPYGPNAFNELVKYRDTLQAQLADLNNNQASVNLFGNVNRYNYAPANTTNVATTNKQPVMTPTQDEIINNVMNRVGNNIPSNIQLKEGILITPTIDTKTPIETIKAATETPTTPQLLPPKTPAEQLPDVPPPTFMQLYRRFRNLNRAPYVSAKAVSTKVYPAYEPPQSKSITQSINLYDIEPTVKTPVVNVPTEQEYKFYDTLEQINSLSDAIKFIPGLVAGMGKVIDFPKPEGVVTKTPTKGGILKYVLPAIAGVAGFGVSWAINKNYGKYAPNYEQTNAGVPPIYPSPNSSSFQISNDIYRTLLPASLFSRMQNFEQFSKSSGDIGPTINRPDTKTQEYSKILGTWTLPIVFGGYSLKSPKTGIPLAFTSAGGALLGQNLAKNNPPNYSFNRLFNYNDLAPYAKLGVVVMTTDYNGRPYLLFPELVYKEGKITPTGRFSHYMSLYDKDSIQQVAGNNIQVARDDTKGKYIYYFTPTGGMSKGALPIAFVNTTPQIVNDIFNKIEGSSNNQLTTKIMDIKDFYNLSDIDEFIPEFHNLFEVNTPTITVPTKADSTSSNTGSGNTGSKGTSGKGTGSGSSNNKQNKEEFTTGQENWDNWFNQLTGQ